MNKGFSIVEMLIILVLLSAFQNLSFKKSGLESFKGRRNLALVETELTNSKIESMVYIKRNCIPSEKIISSYEVCFNKKGNASRSQTLSVPHSNRKIVIHLGSGIYEVK